MRIQKTFSSEVQARDFHSELKAKKSAKDQKKDLKTCTVEELFLVYLEEVAEASIKRSPQLVRDFFDHFALYKPSQIDELMLRGFYTQQKIEYDYTAYSLSTRKYQVQGFFKWMVSRGILERNPQQGISFGKSTLYKRPLIWVKPEEIARALEKAKILSLGFIYPILLLINETAAKTKDVMHLKWKDIDFKNRTVTLWEDVKIQRRVLEISEDLAAALKKIDQGKSDYVFTNLESRPHVKAVLTRELRAFQHQAKLDAEWAFRDLRHSFAVNFAQSGWDLGGLQKILGHSHVQMTVQLYGTYQIHNANFFEPEAVQGTRALQSETPQF